jgi:hypothetical protein
MSIFKIYYKNIFAEIYTIYKLSNYDGYFWFSGDYHLDVVKECIGED